MEGTATDNQKNATAVDYHENADWSGAPSGFRLIICGSVLIRVPIDHPRQHFIVNHLW